MVYVPGAQHRTRALAHDSPAYARFREVREAPRVLYTRAQRVRSEAVSRKLAGAIVDSFVKESLPVQSYKPVRSEVIRGGRRWLPAVLRGNAVPASVLVELVNLGNGEDAARSAPRRRAEDRPRPPAPLAYWREARGAGASMARPRRLDTPERRDPILTLPGGTAFMPIYEYRCAACRRRSRSSSVQRPSMTAAPGSGQPKAHLPGCFHLKGGGWFTARPGDPDQDRRPDSFREVRRRRKLKPRVTPRPRRPAAFGAAGGRLGSAAARSRAERPRPRNPLSIRTVTRGLAQPGVPATICSTTSAGHPVPAPQHARDQERARRVATSSRASRPRSRRSAWRDERAQGRGRRAARRAR
jgi:hypothetical protein